MASLNVTFSRVGGFGVSQLGLLDGLTKDRSGPDRAPAKVKVSRARSAAPMIQGICGPTFFASSVPDGPMSLWESKLRERLARIGSTEFGLTWNRRATPSGRSISRLVPSTRRISVTGSIGQEQGKEWPSPTVAWAEGGQTSRSGDRKDEMLIGGLVREGSTWSTPTVQDSENCAGPSQFNRNSAALNVQAVMHEKEASSRTTPCADDMGLRTKPYAQGGSALSLQAGKTEATGPRTNGGSARTEKRGALSPDFVFWLMGFPAEYRSCALEAMRSLPSKRRKSSPR